MTTIQPFQYVKATAFKERVDIINKTNEIIGVVNELSQYSNIVIEEKDGYYTMVIN